jgi:hypothetical protein
MPGPVPGIHVFTAGEKTWMAGTSPAMTTDGPFATRYGFGSVAHTGRCSTRWALW